MQTRTVQTQVMQSGAVTGSGGLRGLPSRRRHDLCDLGRRLAHRGATPTGSNTQLLHCCALTRAANHSVCMCQVTSYVHGATELLGVQIDAAINSGNSGALLMPSACSSCMSRVCS